MSSPAIDPRWPFPVVLVALYTLLLLPSIAILAMYSPIMASFAAEHSESSYGAAYKYACSAIVFSGVSVLHVVFSFGAMMYSCLAPAAVVVLATMSAFLWGAAVGGSSVFWERNRGEVCGGHWGHGWTCKHAWVTIACAGLAVAASLVLMVLSWYTLLKHISNPRRQKTKQVSTSVIHLGPPLTPPVNLTISRTEIDSLLEEGRIDTPPREPHFSNPPHAAEFRAAGGAGKLILARHLDPTGPDFKPGMLLYGPSPEPKEGRGRKDKGKNVVRNSEGASADQRRLDNIRNSTTTTTTTTTTSGAGLPLSSSASSKRSTNLFGAAVLSRKPLPALPPEPALRQPRQTYYPDLPLPQPAYTQRHHISHSDIWHPPGPSVDPAAGLDALQPPPIPKKSSLRRIHSAPPGTLQQSRSTEPPADEAFYFDRSRSPNAQGDHQSQRPPPGSGTRYAGSTKFFGTNPAQSETAARHPLKVTTTATSAMKSGGPASASPITASSPHAPRKSSNLAQAVYLAELEGSTVTVTPTTTLATGEAEGLGGSWDRGLPKTLLPRASANHDLHPAPAPGALSTIPPPPAAPPRDSEEGSDGTLATLVSSSELPGRAVRREDTFSSDISDESAGSLGPLDPEKMDLVEAEAAEKRAGEIKTDSSVQEMAQVPDSPPLTLPRLRSVSSPVPLTTVTAAALGDHRPAVFPPFPHAASSPEVYRPRAATNRAVSEASLPPRAQRQLQLHGQPVSETSTNMTSSSTSTTITTTTTSTPGLGQHRSRYPTIAPLTITKDLPSLPSLPSLHTSRSRSRSRRPVPVPMANGGSTPTSPRTPIRPDLRTECVGSFTMQLPGDRDGPSRPRFESISSVSTNYASESASAASTVTIRGGTGGAGAGERGRPASLELAERLPVSMPAFVGTVAGIRTVTVTPGDVHTNYGVAQLQGDDGSAGGNGSGSGANGGSGPGPAYVRFELSRNEFFTGMTWGSSSSSGEGGTR